MAAPEYAPRLKSVGAGQTANAQLLLAKTLFQKGRLKEALAELDAALAENPELPSARFLKGLVLARQAAFEASEQELEIATRLEPSQARHWLALAFVRSERGRHREALQAIDRGLAIDEAEANAHYLRGNILSALDDEAGAIEAFRGALKHNPMLTSARYKLSHLLDRAGRTEEAIQQATVALRLNPMNPNTRIALGEMLRRLGRIDEAIREFKAATGLPPVQALPYLKLGEAFLDRGLSAEAMVAFRTGIRIDSKLVEGYLNLARIYLQQGHPAEALEMLRAALEVDPRYAASLQLMEEVQAALKTSQAAPSGTSDPDNETLLDTRHSPAISERER